MPSNKTGENPPPASPDDKPRLDIDAHVVRQLGEQLITDAEQSLLELIKNTYDADASTCLVSISIDHTEPYIPVAKMVSTPPPGTQKATDNPPDSILSGKITVWDDGIGMDEQTIRRGWLTISLSPKREMKRLKLTTKKGRVPQGDKGLGRLGTMKLGDLVRIVSHHNRHAPGYKVVFSWNDCKTGVSLSDVPVWFEPVAATGKTGTTLDIVGLSDPSYWVGPQRTASLSKKMSGLISPFNSIDGFKVRINANGHIVDLQELPNDALESASAKFDFDWNGEQLIVRSALKRERFRNAKNDDVYSSFVLSDNGRRLYEFMRENAYTKSLNIRLADSPKWYVEMESVIEGKKDVVLNLPGMPPRQDPGAFKGVFYSFQYDQTPAQEIDISSASGDLQQFIKELAGIYIYRGGFQIRMGKDWLGLGGAWTAGRSYYSLRPNNTLGYFSITQKDNPNLEEKSDREGFVDNAAWRGFEKLAGLVLQEINNEVLTKTRRAYAEFEKLCQQSGSEGRISVEASAKRITEIANQANSVKNRIQDAANRRASALNITRKQIEAISLEPGTSARVVRELKTFDARIQNLSDEIQADQVELNKFMQDLSDNRDFAKAVSDRLDDLNLQMADVHDTLAIGLAAQGLAHEVSRIVDEILSRVRRLRGVLTKLPREIPAQVFGDIETIKVQATLIGKKVAFIDPMLRTYREIKEKIDLHEFIEDFISVRKDRYDRLGIKVKVNDPSIKKIILKINRGRLTQVLDNLSRNSEYWLAHFHTQNASADLVIAIDLSSPLLIFSDSGYGIRPAKEDTVFDMFSTDKPRGEGQGLGLYITSQILRSEGCYIALSNERNSHERRYKFVVDFSGAITS